MATTMKQAAKAKAKPDIDKIPSDDEKPKGLAIPKNLGEMTTLRIRFIGITPLIQHSTRGMDLGDAADAGIKTPTKKLTKEQIAELGTYPTGDGRFYHPADAFRSACIDALVGTKIGKASAAQLFSSCLFTSVDRAILVDPDNGKPLTKYEIDDRIARNPSTGGAVRAIRPMWAKWACEVEFEYDSIYLSPGVILDGMNLSGQRIGIGILRPTPSKKNPKRGKGGRFGKYRAELIKD